MKVVIVGVGYVGLTTAVCLAYIGHEVCATDTDREKILKLRRGISPIEERGMGEMLGKCPTLRFYDDLGESLSDADVVMIAVGTPSLPDGSANLAYVEAVTEELCAKLRPSKDTVIVIKSTVPPGMNERSERLLRGALSGRGGEWLHIASNPEFLREGVALSDTLYPDRIVIGSESERAFEILEALYEPILKRTFEVPEVLGKVPERMPQVVRTNFVGAEMIKYASNAFLATKISFINEMAELCELTGADIGDVSRGMGLDHRIAPYFLKAGLGWGGSCFPKDTIALRSIASDYGYVLRIIEAACEVNDRQIERVLEKLLRFHKIVRAKRILILGITFKPLTDDVRHSPAITLAKRLSSMQAEVVMHDPWGVENARRMYKDLGVVFESDLEKGFEQADSVIVATEWSEYKSLEWERYLPLMRKAHIVDARHVVDGERFGSMAVYDTL